jgi:hypothetical protein
MTLLDLLLLWLAIGAALFVADLVHTTGREWASLRRSLLNEVMDMPPIWGALAVTVALLFACLAILALWCLFWPMRLRWLFRGRR